MSRLSSLGLLEFGGLTLCPTCSWETKFLEKMGETRQKELDALWSQALTTVWGGVLMFGAPVSL